MKRRLFNLIALLGVFTLAFSSTLPVGADAGDGDRTEKFQQEFTDGVYLVQMLDEPVVAYEGDIAGYQATNPSKGGKIDPNSSRVVRYSRYLDSKHDEVAQCEKPLGR